MRIRSLVLSLVFLASACVEVSNPTPVTLEPVNTPICPEFQNLGCMSAPQCQLDSHRGCQTCACSPAGVTPTEGPQRQPLGTPTNPPPSTNTGRPVSP